MPMAVVNIFSMGNLRTQPAWADGAPPAERVIERVMLSPIRSAPTEPAGARACANRYRGGVANWRATSRT